MTTTRRSWNLAWCALLACRPDPTPAQPPERPAAVAARTSDDAATPVPAAVDTPVEPAVPATPSEPPPDAMHVVVEGRCTGLHASLVGDEVFVTHGAGYTGAAMAGPGARHDLVIGRLQPDGTVESLPPLVESQVAPELGVYAIDGVGGRWPDQLYLQLSVGYRDSATGDLARFDGQKWLAVDPTGKRDTTAWQRVYPWYDNSILAVGSSDYYAATRFAVTRGRPQGPKLGAITKLGCAEPMATRLIVREDGDVFAAGRCDGGGPSWLARWTKDDRDGKARRIDGGVVGLAAVDGAAFALFDGTSPSLLQLRDGDWVKLALPGKGAPRLLALTAAGEPWVVLDDQLHRREGDAWSSEPLPGEGAIEELVGVEQGTPWLRRGGTPVDSPWNERMGARLFRRGAQGWSEITIAAAAFTADKRIGIDRLLVRGPDDIWAEGHYFVKRPGKQKASKTNRVVLHSRAPLAPLRCGDVVDGPLAQGFARWPRAVDAHCTTRMALLFHQGAWDDGNDYGKLRRAIAKVEGLDGARLLEVEVGGEHFLAATVATDATAEALMAKARKQRPYKFPEVVCGDSEELDGAGVVVHRELPLAPP
ncbi:MAG: hypothetical protein K1X88_33775 [Nannocystaceae bacterium]|nr:hypothetical protein [Nannocystaceae bacterium]